MSVLNISNPPTDLNSTALLTITENQPTGTIVGEFNATDPEGGAITYSLVSGEGDGNNSLFTILTPLDINLSTFGNMHLWLDGNDSSTITHSSNYVSQWRDKSGRGYNFTQSSTSNKPRTGNTLANGTNALDFDGSDFMHNIDIPINGRHSIFVVASSDLNGYRRILDIDNISSSEMEMGTITLHLSMDPVPGTTPVPTAQPRAYPNFP